MVLMLLGISLFGAITATITSYLLSQDSHQGQDDSLGSELERLAALHGAGALTNEEFVVAKRRLLSVPTRRVD